MPHEVVRTSKVSSVEEAAEMRGVAVEALVKTLVVRRSEDRYVLVCVPGSRSIDWAKLRRHVGERRMSLPDAAEARDATGYERGTITPFGAKGGWAVIVDATLMAHHKISIGGGDHGVSMLIRPTGLVNAFDAAVVDVTR